MIAKLQAKFDENPLAISALLLLALSSVVTLSALGFEHIGGYKPCPLCLVERKAWYFTIVASLFVFLGSKSKFDGGYIALLLIGLIGLGFLYNAYLAGFHAGIEWKLVGWPHFLYWRPVKQAGRRRWRLTGSLEPNQGYPLRYCRVPPVWPVIFKL